MRTAIIVTLMLLPCRLFAQEVKFDFSEVPDGFISALAFSPDGSSLTTAAGGVVRILDWDTATGKETARTKWKHKLDSGLLAIFPDGKQFFMLGDAPGEKEGEKVPHALLWKTGDQEESRRFPIRQGAAFGFVSPDGTKLLVQSVPRGGSRTVTYYNIADGKELWNAAGDLPPFGFDSDGRLYELNSSRIPSERKLPNFPNPISPDGSKIALFTGNWDKNKRKITDAVCSVIDTASGKTLCRIELRGIHSETRRLRTAFSPDGKYLLVRSHGAVRIWNADTGKQVQMFAPLDSKSYFGRENFEHAVFSPDSKHVLLLERTDKETGLINRVRQYVFTNFFSLCEIETGKVVLYREKIIPERNQPKALPNLSPPLYAENFVPDDTRWISAVGFSSDGENIYYAETFRNPRMSYNDRPSPKAAAYVWNIKDAAERKIEWKLKDVTYWNLSESDLVYVTNTTPGIAVSRDGKKIAAVFLEENNTPEKRGRSYTGGIWNVENLPAEPIDLSKTFQAGRATDSRAGFMTADELCRRWGFAADDLVGLTRGGKKETVNRMKRQNDIAKMDVSMQLPYKIGGVEPLEGENGMLTLSIALPFRATLPEPQVNFPFPIDELKAVAADVPPDCRIGGKMFISDAGVYDAASDTYASVPVVRFPGDEYRACTKDDIPRLTKERGGELYWMEMYHSTLMVQLTGNKKVLQAIADSKQHSVMLNMTRLRWEPPPTDGYLHHRSMRELLSSESVREKQKAAPPKGEQVPYYKVNAEYNPIYKGSRESAVAERVMAEIVNVKIFAGND